MENKRLNQGGELKNMQDDIWLARGVNASITPSAQGTHTDSSLRGRTSIRKTVACTILVNLGSTYAIASNIRDISLAGVFVEMDTAGARTGDTVEVVIAFGYQGRQIEHRIPALIARIQDSGVGLKFDSYDNRTYTDLVNFLYTA